MTPFTFEDNLTLHILPYDLDPVEDHLIAGDIELFNRCGDAIVL